MLRWLGDGDCKLMQKMQLGIISLFLILSWSIWKLASLHANVLWKLVVALIHASDHNILVCWCVMQAHHNHIRLHNAQVPPFFSCSSSLIFILSSPYTFFTEHKNCNIKYNRSSFSPPISFPECDGLDANEIVNDITLERFNNCNIIVSGGIYIGSVPNFK